MAGRLVNDAMAGWLAAGAYTACASSGQNNDKGNGGGDGNARSHWQWQARGPESTTSTALKAARSCACNTQHVQR
eukprot:6206855-Pleurochrysis_carterae.AAC.1